jgi:hypothetical protein
MTAPGLAGVLAILELRPHPELSACQSDPRERDHADTFREERPFAHNGGVTNDQQVSACPRCGSTDAVHSVQELAALASSQLGQQPGAPQQGWSGEPQQGPVPGWAAEPQAGPPRGPGGVLGGFRGGRGNWDNPVMGGNPLDNLGDDIAGAAVSAAMGLVGRAIGRRVQRTMTERVLPAVQARQQAALRNQMEIAQKYPDLCACLTDKVVFLAGGSRAVPLPDLATVTVQQADELVASLRNG